MKKTLLTLAVSSLAVATLRADVIFTETFNYVDGPIILTGTNLDGTTNWLRHSGSANPPDSLVKNQRIEISATGGTLSRQDDVHRNFTSFTNTQTIVYSSFLVNCTNLPPAVGTYFAHFYVNSTNFNGRVFAQAGTLTGTWRLGIAGAAGTVNKVFPANLALNTDYQVVVQWDPVSNFAATLWVNPLSSADPSVTSNDAVPSPAASTAYGFRQGGSFGSFFATASNLVVATTFDEAATNVLSTNAVPPVILQSPASVTNFIGDAVNLSALANGQGLGSMTYQWTKNGGNVANANGNSNVFAIASAVVGDTGDYRMIATTPFGLSATSSPAFLWITNATTPPVVSPSTATSVPVFFHQSTSLHVVATGPPTITYQWYYTNDVATGANVSGADTDTLSISDVTATNGTAGAYFCVASNPYGSKTSGVFTVTAVAPPAVSIAFLRTLVDANFNATNTLPTGPRWQITGTVTTTTNLTTANTSSYYLQDGTAGINIFVTGGQGFRPALGDVLTFIGFMSSFNSTLELEADTNDVSTSFLVLSNNVAGLPAPKVIPFNLTNTLAQVEALEGSVVMLTNVYFGTNAGTTISTNANTTVTVTNAAGESFNVFFSFQNSDTAGQTLPSFAWTVRGVLAQNLGAGVTPRNQGYNVTVTRFADIVTSEPPAVTAAVATSSSKALTWTAVPYDYSYSALAPQPSYQAVLAGANEEPTNASTATGAGQVVVSPDGSMITVNLSFSGLTGGPATAAHIHGPAGTGTDTGVLFPFSGVPAATSGSIPEQSFPLTPTQAGYLYNGLLYMNVHNATFPGGEIRDQLRIAPPDVTGPYLVEKNFQAALLGVGEVPANVSSATGSGTVVLSPDQTTITVNMSFSGLTGGAATAAHIHGPAGAGTNASVLFPFSGVPAATSGAIPQQSFAITPAQVGYLQTGQLYMNVHNATYTGGEIRGQILLIPSSGLTFPTSSGAYTDKKDTSSQKFYRISSP